MDNPLSVVIIGCGQIAGGYDEQNKSPSAVLTHAGAYKKNDKFMLHACIDPDSRACQKFMHNWHIEAGFANLEDYDPFTADVASICTPTENHEAVLETLLSTSVKAVFCEKPLAYDYKASCRLADLYEKAGIPLAINFLRRWDPAIQALKKELTDGKWGGIQAVTAFYNKGIFNTGSHILDLLTFLLGDMKLEEVSRWRVDYKVNDPTVDATFSTQSGSPVYLIGLENKFYSIVEISILTTEGRIDIESSGFNIRFRRIENGYRFPNNRYLDSGTVRETGLGHAMEMAVENIYSAIKDNSELASNGGTSLISQELCCSVFDRVNGKNEQSAPV